MKVAEVARRVGIGVHAVRFYVRAGLVVPRRDQSNNYKRFGETDVMRLRFIKGLQALGFSLSEIGDFLDQMDAGGCACDEIHQYLAQKIVEIRERIGELGQRYNSMRKVYDCWNQVTDADTDIGGLCRFLEQQASHWPKVDTIPHPSHRSKTLRRRATTPQRIAHGLRSRTSGEDSLAEAKIEQMLTARWASE